MLTSTELLKLDYIPKNLAIIGGGVIGCEFAAVFQALGTEVTIIEMQPRLIPNMDKGLSVQLKKSLTRKKIKVLLSHSVSSLKKIDAGYEIEMQGLGAEANLQIKAEKVLIFVDRSQIWRAWKNWIWNWKDDLQNE